MNNRQITKINEVIAKAYSDGKKAHFNKDKTYYVTIRSDVGFAMADVNNKGKLVDIFYSSDLCDNESDRLAMEYFIEVLNRF